jgi:hypothetical protein
MYMRVLIHGYIHTHTYVHTHVYMYMYMYMHVCIETTELGKLLDD